MEQEEHEYGVAIPEDEVDLSSSSTRVDEEQQQQQHHRLNKRSLMEIEDEALPFSKCRSTLIERWPLFKMRGPDQAASLVNHSSGSSASQAEKEEVDSRSIYVGNVDYACTSEEIRQHFQACGTVNRVTILADKYGQPKGFAYVEFVEIGAVQNALLLNESELHGRKLKVSAKRTNIPGMKQYRGRRPVGLRSRRPFMPSPFYPPYGQGRVPRFRRPMRYRPY